MDDRLQKAMEHAQFRASLDTQRRNLKTRLEADILLASGGGIFRCDASLIGFVSGLIAMGHSDAVVLDTKENPIKITDLTVFRDDLVMTYTGAMNSYHAGYEKLRKARNVKTLLSLD